MTRPPRGVSWVPSAEGQRAPYGFATEQEATQALAASHASAGRLLDRLRGKDKHRHVWTYRTSISGWTLARCECGAEELA